MDGVPEAAKAEPHERIDPDRDDVDEGSGGVAD
jgi:hypothetical protein